MAGYLQKNKLLAEEAEQIAQTKNRVLGGGWQKRTGGNHSTESEFRADSDTDTDLRLSQRRTVHGERRSIIVLAAPHTDLLRGELLNGSFTRSHSIDLNTHSILAISLNGLLERLVDASLILVSIRSGQPLRFRDDLRLNATFANPVSSRMNRSSRSLFKHLPSSSQSSKD